MLKNFIVGFDTSVANSIQHWPGWLSTPMLVITNLGQPLVMGILACTVIALHLRAGQGHVRVVYSMTAALLAMGANSILKHYVHRTRPDTLYVSNMYFQTGSFPSGHTFGVTVICGLLAYLALAHLASPWRYISAVALIIFILAVGVSRVYVGAHFPTDVIAGWLLGALVLAIIVSVVAP